MHIVFLLKFCWCCPYIHLYIFSTHTQIFICTSRVHRALLQSRIRGSGPRVSAHRPPGIPILASPASAYPHSCVSGLWVCSFLHLRPPGIPILASPASGYSHSCISGLRECPFSRLRPPGIPILLALAPGYSHSWGSDPRVFTFLRLLPTGILILAAPSLRPKACTHQSSSNLTFNFNINCTQNCQRQLWNSF